MSPLNREQRKTLAVALLPIQSARTLDDMVEMFICQMQQMHHRGKNVLMQYRTETQNRTDDLVATLRDVVQAYQTEDEVPQRFAAIETIIGERSQTLLDECEAYLAYTGNNYFPLLQDFYKSQRATLFRLLEVLSLSSSTQDGIVRLTERRIIVLVQC